MGKILDLKIGEKYNPPRSSLYSGIQEVTLNLRFPSSKIGVLIIATQYTEFLSTPIYCKLAA